MNDFLRSPFTYQSEIEEDESFCQDYINMDIVYRRNRDYDWISEFWRWGPVTQNNCVYLCLLDPQYNKENFRVRSPRIGWERHGDGGGREIRGMLLKNIGKSCYISVKWPVRTWYVSMKVAEIWRKTLQNLSKLYIPICFTGT